jgi:hypothetical protein
MVCVVVMMYNRGSEERLLELLNEAELGDE